MVNKEKLKQIIDEKKVTVSDIAKAIGINPSTFYRKMSKNANFTLKEAGAIACYLSLTEEEALAIFFANSVA